MRGDRERARVADRERPRKLGHMGVASDSAAQGVSRPAGGRRMSTSRGPEDLIRCIIVDDETLAREGIRVRLEREDGFLVAGECATVDEAAALVREDPPDVLFLDIELPGRDGFSLLEETGLDAIPAVVLVTAYGEHALKAFRARALDYLVKPYDDERFAETLSRIRGRLCEVRDGELGRSVRRAVTMPGAAVGPATPAGVDRITVKSDERVFFVAAEDVDWVEAARDYVVLHVGKQQHMIRQTLGGFLDERAGTRFARIHRSTIVNVERIRELRPYFHGEYIVVLHDGTRLKLSRTYRDELAAALGAKL